MTVKALTNWNTNADMIVAVAELGYLKVDWPTLDPTYGTEGGFWKKWRPENLTTHDLKLDGVDFRHLPEPDASFKAVVLDGPYKLVGTASLDTFDERYGLESAMRWQDRHKLIEAGITECMRVLEPRGYLLIKCQDQVCSGKVRWQTREFADHAERCGADLVDALLFPGERGQPAGRRQVHARRNYSTLLVVRKTRRKP